MKEYPLTYTAFKEGLAQGRLLGLKCLDCGNIFTPPNATCTSCGSFKLEKIDLAPQGNIKTFTVIRVAPAGFPSPYIVGMVELADGPWVVGNVLGLDPNQAGPDLIGKKVSVGHKIFPRSETEGGQEGVTLTFTLTN